MIAKASASTTTKITVAPTSLFNAYPCIKEVTHKYNRAKDHGGYDGWQGKNGCSEHNDELYDHAKAMSSTWKKGQNFQMHPRKEI